MYDILILNENKYINNFHTWLKKNQKNSLFKSDIIFSLNGRNHPLDSFSKMLAIIGRDFRMISLKEEKHNLTLQC